MHVERAIVPLREGKRSPQQEVADRLWVLA
jgi:hypothetical protein